MKIDISTFSNLIEDPDFQFVVLVLLFTLSWLFMAAFALIEYFERRRHRALMSRSPVDGLLRRRGYGNDPYFYAFGDMPGFTREQLETIARRPVELHHLSTGPATPADRAGGGVAFLSDAAAGSLHRSARDVR